MAEALTSATTSRSGHLPRWRWLVTDLDGTLVGRDLEIVESNVLAVDAFQATGGNVIIATGRTEASAARYYEALGLTTPMILYNGARIIDPTTHERLLDRRLGDDWCTVRDELMPVLDPSIGVVAYVDLEAVVVREGPGLADYARRDGIGLVSAAEHRNRHGELVDPTKVMMVTHGSSAEELRPLVERLVPRTTIVQSEATYLEVLPEGADKGAALRWLASHLDVDLAAVAAIGDNPNDIAMLRTAGLGAAVGDGHSDVRAAADIIVAPCAKGAVADLVGRLTTMM